MKALYLWNTSTAVALGVVVMTAAVVLFPRPPPAPPGIHVPATPAPELKREETVPVQVAAPVQAYKPPVKKKLKLPPAVQADAAQHVVASTRTPNDERQHTVTTVLDSSTGEFTSYDRAEPLPWVAVNTTTHLAAYYGLKNSEQTLRLQAQQELLRIKALRIEAAASADITRGDVDTFIGVGARLSF